MIQETVKPVISALSHAALAGAVLVFFLNGAAAEDTKGQLYTGKTIRILIGSTPGGSHDLEARVIARHVSKYIPGNPNVIVQNMPGAGSRIMVGYLYNRAKPDGLTWGVVGTTPLLDRILGAHAKFDPAKMPAIWAVHGADVAVVSASLKARHGKELLATPPGDIVVAGRLRSGASCMKGRLYLELLGVKGYKVVCAYNGTRPIASAMERGEVSLFSANDANLMGSGAFAELTSNGKAIPIFQSGMLEVDGSIVRSPTVHPNVPTFYETLEEAHGKAPTDIRWIALRYMSLGLNPLKRTLLMPPGTSEVHVRTLREAIEQMARDSEFVMQWEKFSGQRLGDVRIPGRRAEKLKNDALKHAPWQDFLKEFAQQ